VFESDSCISCDNIAYAQISEAQNGQFSSNSSQQWIDKNSDIRILFGYSPTKPVVDSPTVLQFIVQDLKTNKPMNNLQTHVIVTTNSSDQEQTFRFNNVKAPNGMFSVRYLFPDYGTYQVIAILDQTRLRLHLHLFLL
jgi:hypothetical protein